MALSTGAKIGIGAAAAWLGYAMFAPRSRFVGDRLKRGDHAVVDLSFMPELRAVLPPGAGRVVVVLSRSPTLEDSFLGEVTSALGPDGAAIPLVGLGLAGAEQTFPRAAVVEIRRPKSGGGFDRVVR